MSEVSFSDARADAITRFAPLFANSDVAVTLADPTVDDCPLVYVNQAFSALTQYSEEDAIGRNCRFLQGDDTAPEPIAQAKHAIAARRNAAICLKNYRHDGSAFGNMLFLTPLSAPGNVDLIFGCQFAFDPAVQFGDFETHARHVNATLDAASARWRDAYGTRLQAMRLRADACFRSVQVWLKRPFNTA